MDITLCDNIATRLRNLRNQKGLSVKELAEELRKQYGIDISVDSLKYYESTRCKRGHCAGMRIEYLWCLSDYYGVSADYLLCFTKKNASKLRKYTVVVTSKHTVEVTAYSTDEAIDKACEVALEYDADERNGKIVSEEEID